MAERKNNSRGGSHRRDEDTEEDSPRKVFNNHDPHPHTDDVNRSGWLGRVQQNARPMANRLRRLQTRLDEGAILRKRITVLVLLGLMLVSLAAGKLMSPPASVIETAPNVQKEFVSGDTIEMQKTSYDKGSHTARIDLQTSSPTGVVSPRDLSVNFTPLKKPSNKLPAPRLYMIPTINNHFIVVIRNLYPGFQAMEMSFRNHGDFPIAQYRNALSNGSNGASPSDIKQNGNGLSSDTHIGAPYLSASNKELLLSQSSSPEVQDKQQSLLKKLGQANQQLIVLRENTMFAKAGSIPATLNPKDISINDIDTQVQGLQSKINNAKNGIQQNNALLNRMKKQSSTLSKDASVDKNYRNEIDSLNNNINNTKLDTRSKQSQINQYQKQINDYNDELNQLKNDRISFNAPVQQSGNNFSSK